MGPIKRRMKKSYTMTSQPLEIQSKRPWYINLMLVVVVFIAGYATAFWQISRTNIEVDSLKMSNESLEVKAIKLERKLDIQKIAQQKLQDRMNEVQDELLKAKEEIVFYERLSKKKKRR